RVRVENLVKEFADTFALSLSEVKPNQHTKHCIHVPPEARLPRNGRKPSQPLTLSQCTWLYDQVNKLEEAGIITRISYDEVKCVN
ncbi:hypothetical protein M422DRAFT_140680, partial [Sphaerobolus stellatus SS14]